MTLHPKHKLEYRPLPTTGLTTIAIYLIHHNDGPTLVLPNHLPKVNHCVLHWSLSGNVRPTLFVTLHTE